MNLEEKKRLGFIELAYTLAKRDLHDSEVPLWEEGVRDILEIKGEKFNMARLVWGTSRIPVKVLKIAVEKMKKIFPEDSPIRVLLPCLEFYCQARTGMIDPNFLKNLLQDEKSRKNSLIFLVERFRFSKDEEARKNIAKGILLLLTPKDLFISRGRGIRIKDERMKEHYWYNVNKILKYISSGEGKVKLIGSKKETEKEKENKKSQFKLIL